MGPGIAYNATDRRIYVRLENSSEEAQCGRAIARLGNIDPRAVPLWIAASDKAGLFIRGSHHVFENFRAINNYDTAIWVDGAWSELDFRNVGGRPMSFGARLGHASGVRITNPGFDGCMLPERWWVAYSDIKGIVKLPSESFGQPAVELSPARHVRKCGIDFGDAHGVTVTGGYFHDFFDGALSEAAHDLEVENCEFSSWDDAWQMYGSLHRVDVHHNVFLGAGPSRDGSATDKPNPDPGTVWIHDNIIDSTRYRLFWYRFGSSEDPKGSGWREPIPFSAHNVPSVPSRRTIPWKLYHNTVVTGITGFPVHSYVGVGQFGTREAMVEASHEVYNNIFVVNNARGLGQEAWAYTGAEIYDGNVYWGWHTPTPDDRSIWRFLHLSAASTTSTAATRIGEVGRLRDLARDASRTYYPPGWEAAGLSEDPKLDAAYRPTNLKLASGAVDLTAKRWPGTPHGRYRGAVPPP
jgi:hypothetical protein